MKYRFSGLQFSLDDPGFELDGAEDRLVLPGQVVDILRVARSQPLLELLHQVFIITSYIIFVPVRPSVPSPPPPSLASTKYEWLAAGTEHSWPGTSTKHIWLAAS